VRLEGELAIPRDAIGIVLFAHGSGRLSPRSLLFAARLQHRGIGMLLFDLLTEEEASDRDNAFDIDFLVDGDYPRSIFNRDVIEAGPGRNA